MADLRGQVFLDFHSISSVYYSAIRLLLAFYGSSFYGCSVYQMYATHLEPDRPPQLT